MVLLLFNQLANLTKKIKNCKICLDMSRQISVKMEFGEVFLKWFIIVWIM